MTAWIVVLAVGAVTYALRASMFVLLGNRELPGWTARPMTLVGPAAIGALVGSMLFTDHGEPSPASVPELLAIVAAGTAVRRTGNVLHAFTVGLPVLWLALALAG